MSRHASIRPGIACLLSIGACFLYAAFRSELPTWWRNHGGGVPYVLFWILLWLTFAPRRRALLSICLGCVMLTCALEAFQLYQGPEWLATLRRTRLGAAWLGCGFDWMDIPPYLLGGVAGGAIGWLLLPQNQDR